MNKNRKSEIFNKVKSVIKERGYGSTLTDDESRFELQSLGIEIGDYVDAHPSFETVARISNIIISLNELNYSYSLNELMYLLSLDSDEIQDIYQKIKNGTYLFIPLQK